MSMAKLHIFWQILVILAEKWLYEMHVFGGQLPLNVMLVADHQDGDKKEY